MSRKIYEKAIYGRDKQMQRKVYQRTNNVLPTDAGDYEITAVSVVNGGEYFREFDSLNISYLNQTTTDGVLEISGADVNGTIETLNISEAGVFKRDMSGEITVNKGIGGIIDVIAKPIYTASTITLSAGGSGYAQNDIIFPNVTGTSFTKALVTVDTVDGTGKILTISVSDEGEYPNDISGTVIPTAGGTGSGAKLDITSTVNGEYFVSTAEVNNGGSGFEVGDAFTINVDGETTDPAAIEVASITETGGIDTINLSNGGRFTSDISNSFNVSTGQGAILDITMSLIEA